MLIKFLTCPLPLKPSINNNFSKRPIWKSAYSLTGFIVIHRLLKNYCFDVLIQFFLNHIIFYKIRYSCQMMWRTIMFINKQWRLPLNWEMFSYIFAFLVVPKIGVLGNCLFIFILISVIPFLIVLLSHHGDRINEQFSVLNVSLLKVSNTRDYFDTSLMPSAKQVEPCGVPLKKLLSFHITLWTTFPKWPRRTFRWKLSVVIKLLISIEGITKPKIL